MSFDTGLAGLSASSKSLDVIGNNIANANTVGMKSSRTEFADLVAASLGSGGSATGAGIGVTIAAIAQQFTQGDITTTGNNLDVAINGGGFFRVTKTDGTTAYTRDGEFKLDKNGFLVTNTGANVMGYPTDLKGTPTSTTAIKMSVPTGAPIPAKETTAITIGMNLDARAVIASSATPPTPVSTYGTSLTAYDSQGVPVPVNLYFSKIDPAVGPSTGTGATTTTPATDQWEVFTSATGGAANSVGIMAFDATGALVPSATTFGSLTLTPASSSSIVTPFTATVDVSGITQYGTAFNVSNLTQDGYTAGDLTGVTIGQDGVITTNYSNGQTQAKGQIALASFRNMQGLAPTGAGEYVETFASGQPVQGAPNSGQFGALRSGAVEASNVDLTAQLVDMMTAQRNYQANAQTIKTQDQIMSTLVNLR